MSNKLGCNRYSDASIESSWTTRPSHQPRRFSRASRVGITVFDKERELCERQPRWRRRSPVYATMLNLNTDSPCFPPPLDISESRDTVMPVTDNHLLEMTTGDIG